MDVNQSQFLWVINISNSLIYCWPCQNISTPLQIIRGRLLRVIEHWDPAAVSAHHLKNSLTGLKATLVVLSSVISSQIMVSGHYTQYVKPTSFYNWFNTNFCFKWPQPLLLGSVEAQDVNPIFYTANFLLTYLLYRFYPTLVSYKCKVIPMTLHQSTTTPKKMVSRWDLWAMNILVTSL